MLTDNGIEHRLTKINNSWMSGQVERMTIKEATVKHFHHDDHDQLPRHLQNFVDACNFGLKALKSLTPNEFICKR